MVGELAFKTSSSKYSYLLTGKVGWKFYPLQAVSVDFFSEIVNSPNLLDYTTALGVIFVKTGHGPLENNNSQLVLVIWPCSHVWNACEGEVFKSRVLVKCPYCRQDLASVKPIWILARVMELKVAQINYVSRNQLHCTENLNFGLMCKKAKHCSVLAGKTKI